MPYVLHYTLLPSLEILDYSQLRARYAGLPKVTAFQAEANEAVRAFLENTPEVMRCRKKQLHELGLKLYEAAEPSGCVDTGLGYWETQWNIHNADLEVVRVNVLGLVNAERDGFIYAGGDEALANATADQVMAAWEADPFIFTSTDDIATAFHGFIGA